MDSIGEPGGDAVSAYRDHLKRVLQGDKGAYGKVMAQFRDMALSLAVARTGDRFLAEDAVQEAFLGAFIKLPLLRDLDAFPGWFKTILLRHCDRIRLCHRRALPSAWDGDIPSMPGESPDPSQVYARNEDAVLIRRILGALPGVAREACIQHYVHGRSCAEIAAADNVPRGTVKRRLHDARRRILAELAWQRGDSVRLGCLPISDHLLGFVAHHRHDRASCDLALTRFLSWDGLVRALEDGQLDAAFVMAPLAMSLRNRGVPLRYVLDGHHDGSAVTLSTRDSRPCIATGATMALPHCISTHGLLLHSLLGGAPGSPGEARDPATRFISPSYIIGSLARREIDGFLCSEPWNTKSVVQGQGRIVARSRDLAPGHICCVLVVVQKFMDERPELLERLLSELTAAGEFIESHPDEAARIQARYTGVDRDVAEHVLRRGYITFSDLAPDRGRAEQVMALALDAGVLERACDLDAFMG